MAATAKSRRACGPSFVFLARPRSCDALKSPRNATGIVMTNLHRSPPLNQSKIDLGIVNESQLLRFGISVSQIERVGNAGEESRRAAPEKREPRRTSMVEHHKHHRSEKRHQIRMAPHRHVEV